ncbi:MAG TPA: hypothetical protein VF876_08720 [Burkholderiales bacterium]
MKPVDLQRFAAAVQRNCDVANARHAHEATMCTYLLQMRELYGWEQGLALGAQPARAEVSRWLTEREAAWRELEEEGYRPLPLGARELEPFDAAAVNRELLAQGLVYGAGYGRFHRPHFFLAELVADGTREGVRVLVAGRELARDVSAIPAALQGEAIYVRRDALRRWLWEKVDFWRARRPGGALASALEHWGLAAGDDAAFERMVDAELETLILHELGEARAGAKLGAAWEEMLAALEDRRLEILARAVRDNLADCLSTLPALLERDAHASLHFWFSQLDGMRRELFPALGSAYAAWRESGRPAALQETIGAGAAHWERAARQLLSSPGGADARALAF